MIVGHYATFSVLGGSSSPSARILNLFERPPTPAALLGMWREGHIRHEFGLPDRARDYLSRLTQPRLLGVLAVTAAPSPSRSPTEFKFCVGLTLKSEPGSGSPCRAKIPAGDLFPLLQCLLPDTCVLPPLRGNTLQSALDGEGNEKVEREREREDLLPHQTAGLEWMRAREQSAAGVFVDDGLVLACTNLLGQDLYVWPSLGILSSRAPTLWRGGWLHLAPGTGKTRTALGLVRSRQCFAGLKPSFAPPFPDRLAFQIPSAGRGRKRPRPADDDDDLKIAIDPHGRPHVGATLAIVAPAELGQWLEEAKLARLRTHVYRSGQDLAPCEADGGDLVITTYAAAAADYQRGGALFRLHWCRVLMDEPQNAQLHLQHLAARSRWILTGRLSPGMCIDPEGRMRVLGTQLALLCGADVVPIHMHVAADDLLGRAYVHAHRAPQHKHPGEPSWHVGPLAHALLSRSMWRSRAAEDRIRMPQIRMLAIPPEADSMRAFNFHDEDCPVCLQAFAGQNSRAQTVCGHLFCRSCLAAVLRMPRPVCPTCRHDLAGEGSVPKADADQKPSSSRASRTRIETVADDVCQRASTYPPFRAIARSRYPTVLRDLGTALAARGVRASFLQDRHSVDRFVSADGGAHVLLVRVERAAHGLNLHVAASHIYMMEPGPDVQPAEDERQAIRSLSRLGQTRPVTVTYAVVAGSAEERVMADRTRLGLLCTL